uniref:Uncharacterized protein n=1 Tax=Ciona intestinalis TaxID=7719 RepID=H2XLB0_CIOIN
ETTLNVGIVFVTSGTEDTAVAGCAAVFISPSYFHALKFLVKKS